MRTGIFRLMGMTLLLPLAVMVSGCGNPVGEGHNVRRATGVVITDLENRTLVASEGNAWDGPLIALQAGQALPVRIFFIDPAGERFQLPTTGAEHTLRVEFTPAGIMSYEGPQADQGALRGVAPGETHATIMVWHGAHSDFRSPPLRLEVF